MLFTTSLKLYFSFKVLKCIRYKLILFKAKTISFKRLNVVFVAQL